MQGSLTQFSAVLQQLKQKHANDPQLQQLDALILPTSAKRVKFMSKLAQLCTAICGSSVLFLTGCQHFTQPKAAVTHQVQDENTSIYKVNWSTHPQQTGSAFFTWIQQQDNFDIELSGILGVENTNSG